MNPFNVPELTLQIFLTLDYPTLLSFCQTSLEIRALCSDDYFWRLKVRQDFGVTQYKPQGMSHQEQYRTLYYLPSLDDAIRTGRLDQVALHLSRGYVPTPQQVNLAGTPELLDYFAERGYLPDEEAYIPAVQYGRIDVMDWLWNHGLQPDDLTITESGAGSIPALIWLEDHEVPLDTWTANTAASGGHLGVLRWLEEERGILPDENGANLAAGSGELETLKWLAQRGIFPTEEAGPEAAGGGYLDVVQWLVQQGIKPIGRWETFASNYGHTEIVDWLSKFV